MAAITSGSDHSVFNDGGIPAMQFNYWPDNFYHSSEDRIVYVDPTELKRVGFMAAAAIYYLATAGAGRGARPGVGGGGQRREVDRRGDAAVGAAARRTTATKLAEQHKAVQTKVTGAFNRAKGAVESVLTLSKDADVAATVKRLVGHARGVARPEREAAGIVYAERAAALGVKPVPVDADRQGARVLAADPAAAVQGLLGGGAEAPGAGRRRRRRRRAAAAQAAAAPGAPRRAGCRGWRRPR